jgi:hypothetical protein
MSETPKLPELCIAVDVEADGPIPGPYSMLSLGMAVAGRDDLRFYTELKPISDEYVPAALAVSGLDRERLIREAPAAKDAMEAAAGWVNSLRRIGRPVFLAAPAVWDGMFVHWYFMRFLGKSPFGQTGSGVDLSGHEAPLQERSLTTTLDTCDDVVSFPHDAGPVNLPLERACRGWIFCAQSRHV